jgi:hypothetical protein
MPDNEKPRRSVSASRENFRQPGPLGWKLRRGLANNLSKLFHLQRCCGHPGEPGC